MFARVGTLAGFPPVLSIGAGEDAWSTFTSMSTPPGRRAVLDVLAPKFTPELLATPAAEDRLCDWFSLDRPTPSFRNLKRDLVAPGLDTVRRMLIAAVRRMPACVAHWLLHHTWILGVGRAQHGWCWQAPPYPVGVLTLIVLDGKLPIHDLWPVFAHECAHSWLLPTAPSANVPTLRERQSAANLTKRLAMEWHRPDLLNQEIHRTARRAALDDWQAAALARSWGFEGTAADPEHCAEVTRFAAMRTPWE